MKLAVDKYLASVRGMIIIQVRLHQVNAIFNKNRKRFSLKFPLKLAIASNLTQYGLEGAH